MKVWIVMSIQDYYDAEWCFQGAFSTREKAIAYVKELFQITYEEEIPDLKYEPDKKQYNFYVEGLVEYEVFETRVN